MYLCPNYGRPHKNIGSEGSQPQKHRPRNSAQQPCGNHGIVGFGQIVARIRHHIRRRAAALHGDAFHIRPPVHRLDGASRRRQDYGIKPRCRHRTEDDQQESAFDRRHGNRNQRLPATAFRPRIESLFARNRRIDDALYRRTDLRPDTERLFRPQDSTSCTDSQGAQGTLPRPVRIAGEARLHLRPHRRRNPRIRCRRTARPLQGTLHRTRYRPSDSIGAGARTHHDLAQRGYAAGQGNDGSARLRVGCAALLFTPPDVSDDGYGIRGACAAHILVQLTERLRVRDATDWARRRSSTQKK